METGGLVSRFSQALEKVAHYAPLHQGLSLFEHWLDLVNTVQGARDAVVGPTPKEVIWRKNKARLYRYERTTKATRKTPVLCIMPLINRAYILDLRPGASFVAYLLSQGHDVYLLDWGEWNDEDRSLNLDVLIEQALEFRPVAYRVARMPAPDQPHRGSDQHPEAGDGDEGRQARSGGQIGRAHV